MEFDKYLIEGGRVVGKRCTKCQQMLPLEQFSRKEKGSSRLKSHFEPPPTAVGGFWFLLRGRLRGRFAYPVQGR
jgi:hypothetical protein